MFKINKIEKVNKNNVNIQVTIRFPEDVYKEYKKLSIESNNSLNSLVIASLRYTLQNLEK